MGFVGNFFLFPVVKIFFFANRLRFDEVTAMSMVAPFLEHCVLCNLPKILTTLWLHSMLFCVYLLSKKCIWLRL